MEGSRKEVNPSAARGTWGRLESGPGRAFASKASGSWVTKERTCVLSGKTHCVEHGSSASTQIALETIQMHPRAAEISTEVFINRITQKQDVNVPSSMLTER